MEWLDVSLEEQVVTKAQHEAHSKFTSCYNAVKAQSHYDAGGAPVRDQASTGMNRCSNRMNRERQGLHLESIKMFNTSEMNRQLPGRTSNDRRSTGNNRDGTGNNRNGNLAPPGPNTPRRAPATPRWSPGECRQSPFIATLHK
ncbi:hypothetical protein DPMN_155027 [Dreissena polymorpha]|uniref:Uncharacterized protein n=1 Tax=Dreissena polymorpha TaxID=45954 RepID=A0A9D4JAI4_DREPO|nr:hypothetical protein DPMN_155027 [Dreissena polymorpha]